MSSILRVDEIQSLSGDTVLGSVGELLYSDVPVSFPQYEVDFIPETIEVGEIFYNLTDNVLQYWNGTTGVTIVYYDAGLVTDGLVLHLDAGNRQSYSGNLSDRAWTDLSPNRFSAAIIGTNYWTSANGGFFNYPGGDQTSDYILMPKEAARLTEGYYTMETWLRPNSVSGTRYWNSMASSTTDNVKISNQTNTSIGVWNGSTIAITNGTWYQYVERRQGSDTGTQFLNGVNTQSSGAMYDISPTEGWVLNQEQDSVLGGYDAGQAPNIDFAIVRLYNRALTDAEILQNFETQRSRFGI